MKYKVKITVIDKKLYPELQQQYCHDPNSGICPCYNVGDEFVFYRDDERDDFWHMGLNTLIKTSGNADTVAGGRYFTLYLYRTSRRLYHERLDERRKHHDYLLLGRNKACNFQN